MMKILWLSLQHVSQIIHNIEPDSKEIFTGGGWVSSAATELIKNGNSLVYCFPYKKYPVCGQVDGYKYYTLRAYSDKENYKEEDYEYLKTILDKINPDIVHIFGTEHHQQTDWIVMLEKMRLLDKTIIWIQGLTSFYAPCYNMGIPAKIINKRSLKEFLGYLNLRDTQRDFCNRGRKEINALKLAKHVGVRTDWDSAACRAINPNLKLHYCNETLRRCFYVNARWNISKVERYSIFMSQSLNPIKGLHMVLSAMNLIKTNYKNVHLYTTGRDFLHDKTALNYLKLSSYQKYILELIKKYDLSDNITFLGSLDEEEMKEQYLKAHVFVSASSIENSPNSLGEAMIVGTPCVVSDVGGVKNMLTPFQEGFVYPYSEPYVLADYVQRIFNDDILAQKFSVNAQKHARITHDPQKNYKNLFEIYKNIISENNT